MSWEQLEGILRENRALAEEERQAPPVACPYDGEPLETAFDGSLYCPLGNYRWRG